MLNISVFYKGKFINVKITHCTIKCLKFSAPVVFVVDDVGREITERYYKEGSTLELTCLGIQVDFSSNATEREITWRHGDNAINKGIR